MTQELIQQAQSAMNEVQKYFVGKDLTNISMTKKEDSTPLTEIDTEVNNLLKEALCTNNPEVGWLSEESKDDQSRLEKRYCWIVDPIDGTKELVEGIPEVAVSVGLTELGVPVVGFLFNPLNGEVFPGDHLQEQTRGILVSRTDQKKGMFEGFASTNLDFEVCGSIAYKIGLVASGAALGTVSLTPKNEWDVAAGLALLKRRGGYAQFFDGRTLNSLQLNQAQTRLPGFVAAQDYSIFLELKELFHSKFEVHE